MNFIQNESTKQNLKELVQELALGGAWAGSQFPCLE